jgi:outer membrane protein assembly factor BamD (BamD/ComL family)
VLPEPLASAVKRAPLLPRASVSVSAAPVASVAPPQSTLAEENRWFKEAAEASRSGDVNGALDKLEQLLKEHPQSPLAQTALVRKFRLLAKAGRAEDARREAKRYLAAYPTGFAVNEAQGIEQGSSGAAPAPAEEHAEP